jgi:hypothetical protein
LGSAEIAFQMVELSACDLVLVSVADDRRRQARPAGSASRQGRC